MKPLYPIIATVVDRTEHTLNVSREDIRIARAGRLCPLRRAISHLFPHLIASVGCETFGLRHPDDERLVARGLLPCNSQHFLRLYDGGVDVLGVHIRLYVEWYEHPTPEMLP